MNRILLSANVLHIHTDHEAYQGQEPRTATLTFTQLLSSDEQHAWSEAFISISSIACLDSTCSQRPGSFKLALKLKWTNEPGLCKGVVLHAVSSLVPFCWLDFHHADVVGILLNITVLVVGRQVSIGLDCLDHQLASMWQCFVCAGERLEAVHGWLRQHHEHDQRQGGCLFLLDSSPAALANF